MNNRDYIAVTVSMISRPVVKNCVIVALGQECN